MSALNSLIELPLPLADVLALAVLVTAWFGVTWAIEHPTAARPSVSTLMVAYRREWMQHAVTRSPRVYDAMITGNLRQGTTFFASTSMIALGGGLALIGNIESVSALADDLPLRQAPAAVLEVKVIVALFFVLNAFLKFVWSHRVFGYCSVVMGSVPNDVDDPLAVHRADQAADLNIAAAKAFNRGLRSIYFALGTLAWLLGAVPLLAATGLTVFVLWRREFRSATRATLLRRTPDDSGRAHLASGNVIP